MSVLGALARVGFTEARRNRVTVVIAAFAALLILLTVVVLNTTVFTLDRVVTDFGLGVMSLILVGLSMFLSVGMISTEIERRTVFLVLSRPISRAVFIAGRFLGLALTMTALLLTMSAIYLAQLFLFDVETTSAIAAAIAGLWIELLVLIALGLLFSSFAGRLVSAINVVALYLIGHWAPDLYNLGANPKLSPGLQTLARATYYVVPNLDRFDFKPEAAYAAAVGILPIASAFAYGFGWITLFLGAAALIFSRRDFK